MSLSLGLGLALTRNKGGGWYPAGTTFAGRPGSHRYFNSAPPTCSRAGVSYAQNLAGDWIEFAADTARITDKGLAVPEPACRNYVKSSDMASASVASNTLPTSWTKASPISWDVVGKGTENGLPYIDVRIYGTPSGTQTSLTFVPTGSTAAAQGETWFTRFECKLIAGALTNVSDVRITLNERNSGGTAVAGSTFPKVPSASYQTLGGSRTLTDATTASLSMAMTVLGTAGAAYDFTLRLRNVELNKVGLGSPILTPTNATGDRAAEQVSIVGTPGEKTLYLLLDDLSQLEVSAWESGDVLSTSLTQGKYIQQYGDVSLWTYLLDAWDDFNRSNGAIGVASSGQVWSQVEADTPGGAKVLAVIASGVLVAPDRSSGSGGTAAYSALDLGRNISKMRARVSFDPSDAFNPAAALIVTHTLETENIDHIVLDGSIHIVFSPHQVTVGFYVDDALSNILTWNYTDMLKDGTQYDIGYDLSGETCTLYGPYGEVTTCTDARFVTYAGQYATFEHYWSSSPAPCKSRFHRIGVVA